MKEIFEIKWDLLGAKFATLSDKEQAAFFHGFAKELSTFESNYHRQVQMYDVRLKLGSGLNKAEFDIFKNSLVCLIEDDASGE